MNAAPRARASYTRTENEQKLWGNPRVRWREDGRLEDRYGRTVEMCRADAGAAAEFAVALAELVASINGRLELGREAGRSFWRRFHTNLATLERLARRDTYFAAELERLEAWERGKTPLVTSGGPA